MPSPAISRSSSFCSSTMAQDVGDEPAFLFRISPMSECSNGENGLQHLVVEPQAQSLMSKLRKCLCLGG